jgi:Na+-transporting NADH:ubiquinone oxidoreductase subunit NqrB
MLTTLAVTLAAAFNIIIVIWKFRYNRVVDAIVDGSLLVAVFFVFMGSTQLLIIGTLASFIVSIYLLFSPVKFSREHA